MTQPSPAAAEMQAGRAELSWTEPPNVCPWCLTGIPTRYSQKLKTRREYNCGIVIQRNHPLGWYRLEDDDEGCPLYCRNAEAAAVAQRQRADDAERDYAALLEDYNAAAAWLGVLESGDDLEVAVKSLTDQLSDVLQRADALQAERAAAYVRADTEYAARVRLTEKYDELDAQKDALAGQVERLTAALKNIQEMAAEDLRLGAGGILWQIEADARAALLPAPPAQDADA